MIITDVRPTAFIYSPQRTFISERTSENELPPPEMVESGTAEHVPTSSAYDGLEEASSHQAPSVINTEGGTSTTLAGVHASAAEDQREEPPLVKEGDEFGQPESLAPVISKPSQRPATSVPTST